MNKRIEFLALENKMAFDRMMAAADTQALEIIEVEKAKIERERIAREAAEEIEKKRLQDEAKVRKEREKLENEKIILASQREVRRKRVKAQMKKVKNNFIAAAARKYKEIIDRAKRKITAYCEDPSNVLAIEMRYERLKREFFAPPSPETAEREKILTSHKNIVFLYLDAKLRSDGLDMAKVIFKFDKQKRGFLTYDEFKAMIKALGVKLNPAQINSVIKSVDADGDGCIDLKELEESMKDIDKMGVVGSPWKMYVDAAQDVICYHNFDTGEKYFEYQMKDETLKVINVSNMYGEAETEAKKLAEEFKKKDWEELIQSVMAKRMQWMYKMWKLRKRRKAKLWSLQSQMDSNRRRLAQQIVSHCERFWMGAKVRFLFRRQLHLSYQKVYSVEQKRLFWYNHHLKQAAWERPHLLWRYGDVPLPNPWIPIDVPIPLPELSEEEKISAFGVDKKGNLLPDNREQLYSLHYWHNEAQRDLPRKPDGLPACHTCMRNLADMECPQCVSNFCFTCYRDTHASPYGFLQKARPTPDQTNDLGTFTVSVSVSVFVSLSLSLSSKLCRTHPLTNHPLTHSSYIPLTQTSLRASSTPKSTHGRRWLCLAVPCANPSKFLLACTAPSVTRIYAVLAVAASTKKASRVTSAMQSDLQYRAFLGKSPSLVSRVSGEKNCGNAIVDYSALYTG